MVGSAAIVSVLICVSQAAAQMLTGAALVNALQHGGYVIVMRHASSPQAAPDKEHANADNVKLERQLDGAGRENAAAMGKALRDLKIPIGAVLTSPTYRVQETVKYVGLPNPQLFDQLGDNGQSMAAVADAATAWLHERAAQRPAPGTNTVIITHFPNIARAFPELGPQVAEGEAAILRPTGNGQAQVVARVRIEEWPKLRQGSR
jgi:phosphohistidine phosphatase SixA